MRGETDIDKLRRFMEALGEQVRSDGMVYLTGGATAILHGWRPATVDVDLKADPEPLGFFEAIARLKDDLDINVELASPDLFIPAVPGWRERSILIGRHGQVTFFHYDLCGQALAKLQRRHDRDVRDVRCMVRDALVRTADLRASFDAIEPQLMRYPAIDARLFRSAVMEFCDELDREARQHDSR